MRLLDIFFPRNRDILNSHEKDAAAYLKFIFETYQQGDEVYLSNSIEKLALGLYNMAFKRTSKRFVDLDQAIDPMAILYGNTKGLYYVGVYEAIKETIKKTCDNPVMLRSVVTKHDCEKAILMILKTAASRISEI